MYHLIIFWSQSFSFPCTHMPCNVSNDKLPYCIMDMSQFHLELYCETLITILLTKLHHCCFIVQLLGSIGMVSYSYFIPLYLYFMHEINPIMGIYFLSLSYHIIHQYIFFVLYGIFQCLLLL